MHPLQHQQVLIVTMHQKEKVIAPLLAEAFSMQCFTLKNFDTDQFGTFSGEVPRPASQLETLRRKCLQGLAQAPAHVHISIASEGAFGAHPLLAFVPANIEMVMLIDKQNGLEVVGQVMSTETNFAHAQLSSWEEVEKFAMDAGFPTHALIVKSSQQIFKGINEKVALQSIVNEILSKESKLHVETDMRAMYNPTRQKVIAQATKDLIKKLNSTCPQCGMFGFSQTETRLGLPCAYCGLPTQKVLASVWQCAKCNFVQEHLYPEGVQEAEPMYCSFCNP